MKKTYKKPHILCCNVALANIFAASNEIGKGSGSANTEIPILTRRNENWADE